MKEDKHDSFFDNIAAIALVGFIWFGVTAFAAILQGLAAAVLAVFGPLVFLLVIPVLLVIGILLLIIRIVRSLL